MSWLCAVEARPADRRKVGGRGCWRELDGSVLSCNEEGEEEDDEEYTQLGIENVVMLLRE